MGFVSTVVSLMWSSLRRRWRRIIRKSYATAENRFFSLYIGGGVRKIQSLRIGDRSGRVWFEATDILPNDALYGAWDGQFGGKKAPSDVYIWIATLEYTDGRVDTQSGDVLLVR